MDGTRTSLDGIERRMVVPLPSPGLLRLRPAVIEVGERHGITAAIRFRWGRCVWVVVRTRGCQIAESLTGSAPSQSTAVGADQLGAVLKAIKSLQKSSAEQVYVDSEPLAGLLAAAGCAVSPLFPPAAATSFIDATVPAYIESLLTHLTLATDASVGGRSNWRGHGWVMDFNLDSHPIMGLRATQNGSVLEAELRSIRLGLTAARTRHGGTVDGRCSIQILSDNQTAVRLLSEPTFRPLSLSAGCVSEIAAIAALTRSSTVSYDWVKGHGTHTLNNAADRLAVLARRAKEAELSNAQRNVLLAGIGESAFQPRSQKSLALAA